MMLKGIFLKCTVVLLLIFTVKVGLAQKVTISLAILANPITGKIADLGIKEKGMGYYPINIDQSIGQELGIGFNIHVKQRWGGGAGFSFKQLNKTYHFMAIHPQANFNSFYTPQSPGSFNEKFEVNRIHFNLHARGFIQIKSWKAQVLVGLNQPIIDDQVYPEYVVEGIYTYGVNNTTGMIFNEARRNSSVHILANNEELTLLTEIYIGKEIKKGLFLNAGIKLNSNNNQKLFEYIVTGNLGEANGFVYDETEYPLNRTIIKNRILMYSLGFTYDIDFRNLF